MFRVGQTHKDSAGHAIADDIKPAATCNTVKLTAVRTRNHLRDQQLQASDPDLKIILNFKQRHTERPLGRLCALLSEFCTWSHWDQLIQSIQL